MSKNVTLRTAIFAQVRDFFSVLLFGIPKEIWSDRIKYELRNELNTAWQQLYGNVNSTRSQKGQIMPAEEPRIFSAAQQVKYYEERLAALIDKAGSMADTSTEIDDAKVDLELAQHRLDIREQKFYGLYDVWCEMVGDTGDTKYEYKAYAEKQGGSYKRDMSNDDLRKQLAQRRSALQNIHLPASEIADAEGESA